MKYTTSRTSEERLSRWRKQFSLQIWAPSILDQSLTHDHNTCQINLNGESKKETAHNVAIMLKNAVLEFSDNLSKCWAEFVHASNKLTLKYNLVQKKHRKYLHKRVSKNAVGYYSTAVEPYAVAFWTAADILSAQSTSPARKTQIFNYPDRLSFYVFNSTTLSRVVVMVNRNADVVCGSAWLSFPFHGKAHGTLFLRRFMCSRKWTPAALRLPAYLYRRFQQICENMEFALRLHKEYLITDNNNIILKKTAAESAFRHLISGSIIRRRSSFNSLEKRTAF